MQVSDFMPQESRFSPQRGPPSTSAPNLPYAGSGGTSLVSASQQPQVRYSSTPVDWGQTSQTSQPTAMAADKPQERPKDALEVPLRTMTLSENADIENVNPARPVTKREVAGKDAAPLGTRAAAMPDAASGAVAEQADPRTTPQLPGEQ